MRAMIPLFKLAVVTVDGERVVTFPVGGRVERHLSVEVAERVERRLGWWRSRRRVRQAVWDAVADVVTELKADFLAGDR